MATQVTLNSGSVDSASGLKIRTNGTTEAIDVSTGQVVTLAKDSVINGLTVGRGAGAVSTNTAVGASALAGSNSGTGYNTAVGNQTSISNTTGSLNAAVGASALFANTTGSSNTAMGTSSIGANTTGSYNSALGNGALASNTTAPSNTAVGYRAGYSNVTGTRVTYLGDGAGYNATGNDNTFVGQNSGNAVTSGVSNSILGRYNGNEGGLDIRTASNYIVLSDGDGNPRGWFDGSGYFHSQGLYLITTASAANMNIDSDYVVRRSTSALKYKQDIRDLENMDISLLRPVRYKSKCETDDQTKDHLGLIADEAAEAGFEELVTRGADGEIEGFQYERLTVVLLKKLQVLEAEVKALKGQA